AAWSRSARRFAGSAPVLQLAVGAGRQKNPRPHPDRAQCPTGRDRSAQVGPAPGRQALLRSAGFQAAAAEAGYLRTADSEAPLAAPEQYAPCEIGRAHV